MVAHCKLPSRIIKKMVFPPRKQHQHIYHQSTLSSSNPAHPLHGTSHKTILIPTTLKLPMNKFILPLLVWIPMHAITPLWQLIQHMVYAPKHFTMNARCWWRFTSSDELRPTLHLTLSSFEQNLQLPYNEFFDEHLFFVVRFHRIVILVLELWFCGFLFRHLCG